VIANPEATQEDKEAAVAKRDAEPELDLAKEVQEEAEDLLRYASQYTAPSHRSAVADGRAPGCVWRGSQQAGAVA
jgi:hypothetical protein